MSAENEKYKIVLPPLSLLSTKATKGTYIKIKRIRFFSRKKYSSLSYVSSKIIFKNI